MKAFVIINYVFNIKDITAVNGFTGRPDDDGYLTSPQGQLSQTSQISATSYVDYYRMNMILGSNGNINLPRRINLGLQLNF